MKLYLVHAIVSTSSGGYMTHEWVGTQADAARVRKQYIADGATKDEAKIQEMEVPTNKAGLLEFLNKGQHE